MDNLSLFSAHKVIIVVRPLYEKKGRETIKLAYADEAAFIIASWGFSKSINTKMGGVMRGCRVYRQEQSVPIIVLTDGKREVFKNSQQNKVNV